MADQNNNTCNSSKQLVTFGENFNPTVTSIRINLGDSFRCPCGTDITTDDVYLAAHWYDHLQTACPACKQKFYTWSGHVRIAKLANWKKAAKEQHATSSQSDPPEGRSNSSAVRPAAGSGEHLPADAAGSVRKPRRRKLE